jgi:hypothetical protein
MILMVGLTGVIHVSAQMVFRTQDIIREQQDFKQEYYKNGHGSLSTSDISGFHVTLQETDDAGAVMGAGGTSLELDHGALGRVDDDEGKIHVYTFSYR